MKLQIVTHCWNYARLLTYQLSSFVLHPPKDVSLTMTVFYNEEDRRTTEVLRYFVQQEVRNVTWHWWNLEQGQLFRRAIGRNLAALSNQADWVWFTDCDQVFHEGCLDALPAAWEACDAVLVFPRQVQVTEQLNPDNPMFRDLHQSPKLLEINPDDFFTVSQARAFGALQIVRGDVLRKIGYCKDVPKYMKPAKRFGRTYEDVKFRRILGTNGTPIELPGVYRIEHKAKPRRLWWRAAQL